MFCSKKERSPHFNIASDTKITTLCSCCFLSVERKNAWIWEFDWTSWKCTWSSQAARTDGRSAGVLLLGSGCQTSSHQALESDLQLLACLPSQLRTRKAMSLAFLSIATTVISSSSIFQIHLNQKLWNPNSISAYIKSTSVCFIKQKDIYPLTAITMVPLLFCNASLLTTDYDHSHGQEQ